jgi:LysR family transcriptional activator of nhaA
MYFWLVAREGGLAGAAKRLRLSPQTLSGQIRSLEESVGHRLLAKSGRRLALTEVGKVAHRYADEIFALGGELGDVLERAVLPSAQHLHVGIAEAIPKILAQRLLDPLFELDPPVRLVCREGPNDALASQLASHAIDVVIADEPLRPGTAVRAFNHLLGECGVTFFASEALARVHQRFPRSLDGAPMLLPASGSALRQKLDAWLAEHRIVPRVAGEIEDAALAKALGASGHGIFCAPTPIAVQVASMYGVVPIGATEAIVERFYAITVERRIKNPAVAVLSETARLRLFA